ncbi:MAG: sugar phosphate isomerase/epimerase [Caldilineaceae bacterium]
MKPISFMSANFVARQVNYHMTEGWMQGDRATNDYFRPLDTFAERFDLLLNEVVELGFHAIDIWTGHLNPLWATAEHVAIAKDLLNKHQLQVASLAGGFGSTPVEFARSCQIANELSTSVLGGGAALLATDRASVLAILAEHKLRLGLENHPQKTPQILLSDIGDNHRGLLGACVDTGWFGTQGYDAAQALSELADSLVHVHLKDVLAAGAHQTCRFGLGVVPIERCLQTLQQIGYEGGISVEHEPEEYDPRSDCAVGLRMVEAWLNS